MMEHSLLATELQECTSLIKSIVRLCGNKWGTNEELDTKQDAFLSSIAALEDAHLTHSVLLELESEFKWLKGILKQTEEDFNSEPFPEPVLSSDDVEKMLDGLIYFINDYTSLPQELRPPSSGASFKQQSEVETSLHDIQEGANGSKLTPHTPSQTQNAQRLSEDQYDEYFRTPPSPEEVANSIKDLVQTMHVFDLSALSIAQQAIQRVRAFDVWTTAVNERTDLDKQRPFVSKSAEFDASQVMLAFKLKKFDIETKLERHLAIVKKLFEMLTVEQITIFVLFEDILTAVVMAWTVIVGGDVYEDIVTAEEREKFNTLFVKAIRRDAKEYHRSVESNQRKNGDLQLGFSKIYSQLLREFLKTIHSLKGSDLITTPEARYYSIQELVELGADQIPLLKDIKTGLELIGDRLPLLKQPACSTPQVEFSALASENPEDQNSLSSPFIWLPPPSNSVPTKGKQDTPSSDGVDPLWLEVKRQFVNKMHSSDASTLARYDMTSKIDDVHISYAGTLTELSQGTLWEGSKKIQVAFKVFRAMQDPPRRQKFSNLYFWWLQFWVIFNHQNVVPVLGFMLSTNLPYALVLPWYGSGNIFGYLKSQKGAVPFHRRIQLIRDIVEGMNHYHHHRLVHGDLRGETVLVGDDGTARITKSARCFLNELAGESKATLHELKRFRFLAPELLREDEPTLESDVWAFGCLASQILTDKAPYHKYDTLTEISSALRDGELPVSGFCMTRPDNQPEIAMWKIITSCWAQDPKSRPTAENIRNLMQDLDRSKLSSDANGHVEHPLLHENGDS